MMNKNGFLFPKRMIFNSPSVGKVGVKKMVKEIKRFVDFQEGDYQLVIGSDSHLYGTNGDQRLKLVTAVVIHHRGKGGRFFWTRAKIGRFFSLREKIYQETLASLEVAHRLFSSLRKDLNGEFERLEIHIDVGNKGPTREMIKELVGMVSGNGFTAKTKPDAYGAFVVADRYT